MRLHKPFPRVFLAWGKWWAAQVYVYPHISFGVHVDLKRPLLDLHLGIVTLAFGPAAHITNQNDRHRHSCRGFLFADNSEAFL